VLQKLPQQLHGLPQIEPAISAMMPALLAGGVDDMLAGSTAAASAALSSLPPPPEIHDVWK